MLRSFYGLLLVIVGVACCAGCGKANGPQAKPEKPPLPTIEADLYRVEPRTWPTVVRSQGSLGADDIATIGATVEGRVAATHVDLGSSVSAKSPLITLEHEEFELAVRQAEAQLKQARAAVGLQADDDADELNPETSPPVREQRSLWTEAEANLERGRRLAQNRTITQAELVQLEATERIAEARYASALNAVKEKIALIDVRSVELALARKRLADTVIIAPFDGYVQQRHVSTGAYVRVGDPIAMLVRTNPLRFRGTIPERYAQRLREGQSLALKVESVHSPIEVKVSRISPAIDQRSRALLFEAEVPNPDRGLRSGLFAEASIVVDEQSLALVIPRGALVEFAGAEKVWRVVDGVAAEREVVTGERRDEGIEILSGLEEGDEILLDASAGKVARVKPRPPRHSSDSDEAAAPRTQIGEADAERPETVSGISE